jgi:ABC-type sugar transport system substrate-binding protein
MLDAHNDSDLQRRQVQELLRQHVDLLIISPN